MQQREITTYQKVFLDIRRQFWRAGYPGADLEARELIKGRVLENSPLSPREGAEELARATRSQVVQVIGTKFVLYRESHSKPREKRIQLVKSKR